MPEHPDHLQLDPALLAHLDTALAALLAARLRAGARLPESVPDAVAEAATQRDERYRHERREAADALVALVAAVEDDSELLQLVLDAEAAFEDVISAALDLGWRCGATAATR